MPFLNTKNFTNIAQVVAKATQADLLAAQLQDTRTLPTKSLAGTTFTEQPQVYTLVFPDRSTLHLDKKKYSRDAVQRFVASSHIKTDFVITPDRKKPATGSPDKPLIEPQDVIPENDNKSKPVVVNTTGALSPRVAADKTQIEYGKKYRAYFRKNTASLALKRFTGDYGALGYGITIHAVIDTADKVLVDFTLRQPESHQNTVQAAGFVTGTIALSVLFVVAGVTLWVVFEKIEESPAVQETIKTVSKGISATVIIGGIIAAIMFWS